MIYGLTKNVTTSGTAVKLTAGRTAATWVIIQAKLANTGNICVGKQDVLAASKNGVTLVGGDTMTLPDTSVPTPYDLETIFIDSTVNGEGVSILYGRS